GIAAETREQPRHDGLASRVMNELRLQPREEARKIGNRHFVLRELGVPRAESLLQHASAELDQLERFGRRRIDEQIACEQAFAALVVRQRRVIVNVSHRLYSCCTGEQPGLDQPISNLLAWKPSAQPSGAPDS